MRVVVFSDADDRCIHQLIRRIRLDVPDARVVGVLSERKPGKTLSKRVSGFLKNLRHRAFLEYAAAKLARTASAGIAELGHGLLRFIHGGGPALTPGPDDSQDCVFRCTTDYHGDESLEFVRGLKPDLGVVYGTRILKACLFSIPRLGSINIHKRKLPDYRGGGPVGLWELLDQQPEIGVTVHQVVEQLDAGAVVKATTIPIHPFDNLSSLALKAHLVSNDLLVGAVRDYASGTVQLKTQEGNGRMFKAPSPAQAAHYEKELARRRPGFRPVSSRTRWKLVLKTLVALPTVTLRNWSRRRRRSFPVNILFHHVISDRADRMGMSTERFLHHVRFLQRHYQIVSLHDAIEMIKANRVERPTVVLAFDDGYQDNVINLRAVVEETGVPVTTYAQIGSAFGGNNPPFAGCSPEHPKRWRNPGHLWDLELQLQEVLEPEPDFDIREPFPEAVRN